MINNVFRHGLLLILSVGLFQLGEVAALAADESPREGKYLMYAYGAPGTMAVYVGHFILSADSYDVFLPGGKPSGSGKYQFDPTAHSITWTSGPFAGQWKGDFTIEREGKTHKLRLNRNTVATNSSDSTVK